MVFTGNLDSLTVQAHAIGVGAGRTGADQTVRVTVFIDGESVFGTDASGNAARRNVVLKPVVSSSQASALFEFTIAGLGLVTEDGDGTTEREIAITLASGSEPIQGWVRHHRGAVGRRVQSGDAGCADRPQVDLSAGSASGGPAAAAGR